MSKPTREEFKNIPHGKLGDKCVFCNEIANNFFFQFCNAHTDILREYSREDVKKAIEATNSHCPHCEQESDKEQIYIYGGCQDCCEHEFDSGEGYMCLNCGKDGAEEVLSAAYDQAKDGGKYGE